METPCSLCELESFRILRHQTTETTRDNADVGNASTSFPPDTFYGYTQKQRSSSALWIETIFIRNCGGDMERPSCVVEDLKQFVVNEAPQTAFYIPDFISEAEESFLLQQVYKSPKSKWTQLSGRRLQNWGGLPHPKGMLAETLPDWLHSCCEKVSSLGVFGGKTANHVLVNEYKPGEGIMAHEDGPLYHPTVSTISLGSHTLLDFYRPVCSQDGPQTQQSRYLLSLLLRPRSLLVLQDDMYRQLLHGIQNRDRDPLTDQVANLSAAGARPGETLSRGTRVSLTIRHVPKVIRTRMVLGRK